MPRFRRFGSFYYSAGLAALFTVCAASNLAARKNNDVVIMKNGDRITCEIKRLENGVLYIIPPYALDTYGVDWNQVERVESEQAYRVTLTNGVRQTGTLERTPATKDGPDDVKISTKDSSVEVPADQIALIRQVEEGFWNQQTGSINAGYDFTQGNNSSQLTISGETNYRQDDYGFHVDGSAVFNSQSSARTARYTTNVTYNRYLRRAKNSNWYAGTIANFLKSDQQELDLRFSVGEGLGKDLKRTNRTYLSVIGGAVFTTERYFPGSGFDPNIQNAEAVAGLTFSTYRFKYTEVTNQTYFYPSLTDAGRFRVSTSQYFKFRLARNLDWIFSVYENFDSKPPTNAPRNDAGVSTSLGWTF